MVNFRLLASCFLALLVVDVHSLVRSAEPTIVPPVRKPEYSVARAVNENGKISIVLATSPTRTVEQTYTVNIPFVETKDGKSETKTRTETRTRTVEVQSGNFPSVLQLKDLKFYSVDGNEMDAAKVQERLAKPSGVVVIKQGEKLDPFFVHILKPETLVIATQ